MPALKPGFITFAGVKAYYTEAELELMASLRQHATREELEFIHQMKAEFDGRLSRD